ncbi:MAG: S8 family serine peptidase, partial [Syntrophales bacterium]|nr:S8 family serine peptidase [Syntrophales bacterium]
SDCFAGMAPKARLVLQSAEDNETESLSGIPSDLTFLFSQSEGAGADLHTNSWGGDAYGRYDSDSRAVDEYVWNHKDFLILFSAGNDGVDADGDGIVDLLSVASPATAKNCLTVGASEGNRPTFTYTWGGNWPDDYPTDPIFSDRLADNPAGTVAFSARGPCLDGRYKPDIVTPGTFILSTRSSVASKTGWGAYDAYYMYNGGTSMATPLAAGAAALMREYLIHEKGFAHPSAALIKAALLNSAEDISPGQYGAGVAQEIPDSPVPNNVEGWGRLDLEKGVFPAPPLNILYYDEQNSLNTGEYREYTITLLDSGSPLKINLVWTDYPGSIPAQGGLVNDLDLQVTDPYSNKHYPDGVSQKSVMGYDSGNPLSIAGDNRRAMRFTPVSYPVTVESATFCFDNPNAKTTDVDVVVYDDDGIGGFPGTELFRKTLTYVPTGWTTTVITGVTVNNGDFYIAVEKNDAEQFICVDDDENPTGRSYWGSASGWFLSVYTAYIRANVRYSTSFDRINNVVGLTLDNPAAGAYTVRVSGYNVPYGPQPYALVASGAVNAALLYFPHIAGTGTWKTEICVINTSSQTINGTFKAYNDAGEPVSEIDDVTLAPHGRREITVGDEFSDPADIGYIVFESGLDAVAGYTKFYIEGRYRAAVPAVSGINTGDIYISHIASSDKWWTGISLLNTTSSPKTVTIEFDNGATKTKELAANEHSAFTIRSMFDNKPQPGIHSAVIKGGSGVIGLELFSSIGSARQLGGVLLKDDTGSKIYYPHIVSDSNWWTGIVAYNPSASASTITITPYSKEGASLTTQSLEMSGRGKYIGTVADLDLPVDTAWLQIEATSPVTGLELFATRNGNQLAGYTGVGISGKEGVFAKLEKDGWTGIALANTESSPATVTLTAYNDSGATITTEAINLNAHEKVVNTAEGIFTGDISNATYITYSSNKEVVGFQLNASSDSMMLDALPGM